MVDTPLRAGPSGPIIVPEGGGELGEIIQQTLTGPQWRKPMKQQVQRILASAVIDSGNVTIDLRVAARAVLTLDTDITGTLTVILPELTSTEVQHVSILVQQGAGGETIAAYSANVLWPAGGAAPTLSTGAGQVDILAGIADGLEGVVRMVPSLGFTT